jgi:hypothetical protein
MLAYRARDDALKPSAKSLKCTLVLDPEGLVGVTVPPGSPRVPFEVTSASGLWRLQ